MFVMALGYHYVVLELNNWELLHFVYVLGLIKYLSSSTNKTTCREVHKRKFLISSFLQKIRTDLLRINNRI